MRIKAIIKILEMFLGSLKILNLGFAVNENGAFIFIVCGKKQGV